MSRRGFQVGIFTLLSVVAFFGLAFAGVVRFLRLDEHGRIWVLLQIGALLTYFVIALVLYLLMRVIAGRG